MATAICAGAERERAIDAYSRHFDAAGAGQWTLRNVTAPVPHRRYPATAAEHFVLDAGDQRLSVAV